MTVADELKKLLELRELGALTPDEFTEQKRIILAGGSEYSQSKDLRKDEKNLIENKCKKCGGELEYLKNEKIYFCSFCNSGDTEVQQITLNEIICEKCGGNLRFDPSTQITHCNFCGSKFIPGIQRSITINRPEKIIPFAVSEIELKSIFKEFLIDGDFTPDDILRHSDMNEYNGIYLPFWVFKGNYEGNWSALSGVTYEVRKGSKKIGEQEQWDSVSGVVRGEFFVGVCLSKKITPTYRQLVEKIEISDSNLKIFNQAYIPGFCLEEFPNISSDVSFSETAKEIINDLATQEAVKMIPGTKYRNFSINSKITKVPFTAYLPYWICSYKYKDMPFDFIVDGSNPARMFGTRPEEQSIKDEVSSLQIAKIITNIAIIIITLIISFVWYKIDRADKGSGDVAVIVPLAIGAIALVISNVSFDSAKAGVIQRHRNARKN